MTCLCTNNNCVGTLWGLPLVLYTLAVCKQQLAIALRDMSLYQKELPVYSLRVASLTLHLGFLDVTFATIHYKTLGRILQTWQGVVCILLLIFSELVPSTAKPGTIHFHTWVVVDKIRQHQF